MTTKLVVPPPPVVPTHPDGKTCADCSHFKRRCSWLLSCDGTETSCDWTPSRFRDLSFLDRAEGEG